MEVDTIVEVEDSTPVAELVRSSKITGAPSQRHELKWIPQKPRKTIVSVDKCGYQEHRKKKSYLALVARYTGARDKNKKSRLQ